MSVLGETTVLHHWPGWREYVESGREHAAKNKYMDLMFRADRPLTGNEAHQIWLHMYGSTQQMSVHSARHNLVLEQRLLLYEKRVCSQSGEDHVGAYIVNPIQPSEEQAALNKQAHLTMKQQRDAALAECEELKVTVREAYKQIELQRITMHAMLTRLERARL